MGESHGMFAYSGNRCDEGRGRNRDLRMERVHAEREQKRAELYAEILKLEKVSIRSAAQGEEIDITKYQTYYDLADAIVEARYPNLSDNPNA